MSIITSSGLKTSVCAAAAVAVTALIAWSFDAYTGHLEQRANKTVTTAQVLSATPATDSDVRIG